MNPQYTTGQVLAEAERVFAEYDKLLADKAKLEQDIRKLCLRYGEAFGQWGTRPEHVRNALKLRAA